MTGGQCGEGEECSGGAHPRCVAKHCLQASDCSAGYDCLSAVCVARTCTADQDCGPSGAAFCVGGYCSGSLGQCIPPVP